MERKPTLRSLAVIAGIALLAIQTSHAASGTWDGETSALWNLDSNWNAAFPVTGDTATFNNAGNGNTTIDLGAGASVTTLNFDTVSAAAYTIGSGAVGSQTLTLGTTGNPAGTISMASTVVNNQIFNANVTLGTTAATGTYVLTNNSSSLLTINGGMISGIGGTAGGKTLNVNGTGDTVLNGVLDRGTATSFFVQKNTAGSKLTLGGSSSNLNLTLVVNAGTVELNKSGAANAVSTGTVEVKGSTLQYNASAGSDQIANGLTVQLGNSAGTAAMNMNGVSDTIANLTFFGTSSTSTSQASVTTGAGILTVDGGSVTVNNNGVSDNRGTATISGFLDVGSSVGMNGGRRNFNVADGAAVDVDLEVSAVISSAQGAYGVRKIGTGTMRLTGANTYDGATVIDNGTVEVTNIQNGGQASSLGDSSNAAANLLFVNAGKILRYVGSTDASTDRAFTISSPAGSATIESSGAGTLSFTDNTVLNSYSTSRTLVLGGTNTGANTFGKIISSSTTLNKEGPGTWVLTETNTYNGPTNVNGGILAVNGTGSINNSAVTINGGNFRYNSSNAYTGVLTFTSGTISGTNWNGSLGGLSIGAGQTLSPGNSPGTASTGSQTWATGGSYAWEINSTATVGGTAGGDPGWDLVNGTGTLNITASSGNEFTIDVLSLTTPGNVAGSLAGFNESLSYTWLIADFAAITGFAVDAFTIDTTQFATYNPFTGAFGISLGGVGVVPGDNTQIYLTYTAIPEPAAALLGSLGGLLLLRRRRR